MHRANKTILLATCALVGCAHVPSLRPKSPNAANFSQEGLAADAKWAESFGDPILLELIKQARRNNPEILIARARLREANALMRAADAVDDPTLSLAAGYESSRISIANGRFPPGIPRRTDVTGLATKASWEIDLWGLQGAKYAASSAEALAARFTVAQASLSLTAEVARLWFAVRNAREQVAHLESEFAARYDEMQIMEFTVIAGLRNSDPLSSAKLAAAQAKVDEGIARRRLAASENALRALIGEGPGYSLPTAAGPVAMPQFGPGVPSELLLRRPDLAAAAARLDASLYREGAAIADFYPSVTLTGQAGWQADPASRVGRGAAGFWSLAPTIDVPLFDAGRRKANLEAARARVDGSAAEWTKAILNAFREVEDALANLRELGLQEELTGQVVIAALDRLTNAESRRNAGLADEIEVTLARRDAAMAARALSMVVWERRQVAVQLAASTGGGWSDTAAR